MAIKMSSKTETHRMKRTEEIEEAYDEENEESEEDESSEDSQNSDDEDSLGTVSFYLKVAEDFFLKSSV